MLTEYHKAMTKKKNQLDVERVYPKKEFIVKLRRLAKALESNRRFIIQIAGERIIVPADAIINIEHERGSREEEVEFQIKWKLRE